jgi:two-component system alkaline phosphatase synthesis response regulator PhoP
MRMARPVLVIDDDKVTLTLLERTLSAAGFEVLAAQDGMKGIDLVQTRMPSVVIVDMLIPKIHGLELCKRIRDNNILQDVRIVLMSAVYRTSTFAGVIEKSGADYFIDKPIDTAKLIELVKSLSKRPED